MIDEEPCIVCGREIPCLPDVGDPSYADAADRPSLMSTTRAGSPYHWTCRGALRDGTLQLELFA